MKFRHLLHTTFAALLVLGVPSAYAQLPATISDPTGAIKVGINSNGVLYNSVTGTGVQRTSDGFDPLAPGTPRDSWGVSAGSTAGWSDPYHSGTSDLVPNGSSATAHSASASDYLNAGAGNLLQVDQAFAFPAANVLQITETITNLSGSSQTVNFARDLDWDVSPTEFDEVTKAPGTPSGAVSAASYYGFESPSPLVAFSDPVGTGGTFGPSDLGAGIQLSLGVLGSGQSKSFDMFYAVSTPGQYSPGLASELMGLGASYVITTESSESYPGNGINSAALAYGAVTPEPTSIVLLGLGAVGVLLAARRRRLRAQCCT